MTKLDQLKEKITDDDVNDLQAMGIANQIIREKRIETWSDWQNQILQSPKVKYYEEILQQGKWSLTIHNPEGEDYIIDYYPKANKVLVRKDNQWHKLGLNWLINNILK